MSKQSAYFRVPELSGSHCEKEIKKEVGGIAGVIDISANVSTNKIVVDYDSTGTSSDTIKQKIEGLGYTAQLLTVDDHTM